MIKIDKDSFVWLTITFEQAQIFFLTEAIDIYIVRPESESKAETIGDMQDAIDIGFDLCIEVGHLPKEVIAKKGRKVHQTTFDSEIHTSMEKARLSICENYNLDESTYKAEKQYLGLAGNIVTHFPFNQKVITRILK